MGGGGGAERDDDPTLDRWGVRDEVLGIGGEIDEEAPAGVLLDILLLDFQKWGGFC